VEAWVRSQQDTCGIHGGQNSTVTIFLSGYFGFPFSASFRQCSILMFSDMLLLLEGQTDQAWIPNKKQGSFGNWVAFHMKTRFLVLKGLKPSACGDWREGGLICP